jgi:hypothetical protein
LKQIGVAGADKAKSIIQTGGGILKDLTRGASKTPASGTVTNSESPPTEPKVFDLFGNPKN